MREHLYYVYILASGRNGTLYVGVTNSLDRRTREHRDGQGVGFTRKYGVHRLVWYEPHQYVLNAIHREKQLKRWRRAWKIALLEAENPQWLDLLNPCHPGRSAAETRDPGDWIESRNGDSCARSPLGPGSPFGRPG